MVGVVVLAIHNHRLNIIAQVPIGRPGAQPRLIGQGVLAVLQLHAVVKQLIVAVVVADNAVVIDVIPLAVNLHSIVGVLVLAVH